MNLMEEYGKACVSFEIAQGRMMELKKMIIEDMQKKQDPQPKVEEPKSVEPLP